MKRKKAVYLLSTVLVIAVLSSGCSTDSADQSEHAETQEVSEEAETQSTSLTVQVSEINGSTITAETGELETPGGLGAPDDEAPGNLPDGEPPQTDNNGEAPHDRPDGEPPQADNNGEAPHDRPDGELPQTDNNGEAPHNRPDGEPPQTDNDGEVPHNRPGEEPPQGKSGVITFSGSGETITFEITDSTIVTIEFLQGSQEGTVDDISVGSVLSITLDDQNQAQEVTIRNLSTRDGFGGSDEVTNGTSVYTIDEDSSVDGDSYTSDGDDENALRIDGAEVSLSNITVEKTGGASSNTENGDFYGQNAGLLALNGAAVTIQNASVNTSAVNGNGVFSYGEGTSVTISDSVIRTSENNSGGIQTTGGATTYASNLDVETQGNSSAAIRSDRGGGTVEVDEGTYVTNGTGSPAVYCTADISVANASLTANASEGIVVEGKNSVSLTNCDVTSSMENTYNGDSNENIHVIMIYQSMSGDAAIGEASFSAEGGSITAQRGDMFYITNTDCTIRLSDVKFILANDIFLRVEGNSSSRGWGTKGSNGGDVTLYANAQTIEGRILVDGISSLNLHFENDSAYTGAINSDGEAGNINVVLDETSSWTLTADSYITDFDGDLSNITANGYHLYVNGKEVL